MFCLPGTVLTMYCMPTFVWGVIMGVCIGAILWIAMTGRLPEEESHGRQASSVYDHGRGRQEHHAPDPEPLILVQGEMNGWRTAPVRERDADPSPAVRV